MNAVVVVDQFKTRKAAVRLAANLAACDDGQYWNGREFVQVGSLDFRAVKYGAGFLVVRDTCIADAGRNVLIITL